MKWLAAVLVVACDRGSHVATCGDDLHGVWHDNGGRAWMMLENASSLEAYPLFDDAAPDSPDSNGLVLAPRVLDLHRAGRGLDGEIKRRIMRGADACEARAPFHVTACADDALDIVTTDLASPLAFAPCVWPPPALSRVERWHR